MRDQPLDVDLRWLMRRDLPEVLAIERQSFEWPWSEDDYAACLRRRTTLAIVAETQDQVVGLYVCNLAKSHVKLLNLAVAADARRRCVGSQLVGKIVSKLSPQRRTKILVDVCERNLGAQLFFRALGFVALGMLPAPYAETDDDAIRFVYRLDKQPPPRVPVNHIFRRWP